MSVTIINGDLLDTTAETICHQVNCQGKMGSGVALAIRKKYPTVYEDYRDWIYERRKHNDPVLGTVGLSFQENGKIMICNLFAQEYYGYDGKRYTSYDAFWNCLNRIPYYLPRGNKIAFPYGIGCGLGGANWNIIYKMIEEVLGKNYEVMIYKLEEKEK